MLQSLMHRLMQTLAKQRMHLTSFDPVKHTLPRVAEIVRVADAAGTDGFLLGGSTGVDRRMVEEYGKVIHDTIAKIYPAGDGPPLLLYPSSADGTLAEAADGVLFLSLLNSLDVRFLIRIQAKAAPHLRALKLEPVGCGMIMVAPGGTAGSVGKAELVPRDADEIAVGYASAAEAFGFPFVYLNAGSGSDAPVPGSMIRAVTQVVSVPVIVGGGITNAERARRAVESGARVIVTGTAVETGTEVDTVLRAIITAVHGAAPRDLGAPGGAAT
jgi:phosphoglycerol geranylgeranyltransferase